MPFSNRNDNNTNRISEKTYQLIFFILFLVSFAYLMFFLNTHMEKLLDSDDASELILSKMVAEQNTPLIKEWFYSTELRVLNTQLVYGFFFKFFDSWHTVRLCSIFTMCIILLASCYFMFKQLELEKYFWPAATILVLPFSATYFFFVLKGGYYFPHITISFISIGLLELQIKLTGKKRLLSLLCLTLLAFGAGLGGPRQIIVMYMPALFAGLFLVIKECRKIYSTEHVRVKTCLEKIPAKHLAYCVGTLLAFIAAIVGYEMNSNVLSEIYEFSYFDVSFAKFDIDRFFSVLNGFINNTGYTEGEIVSFNLFYNILSFIWIALTIISIFYGWVHEQEVSSLYGRLSLFTGISYVLIILLYTFSDLTYNDRYLIPIIVYSLPCIILFFCNTRFWSTCHYYYVLIMMFFMLLRSLYYYHEVDKMDLTQELRIIENYLCDNNYCRGYGSFWNANILTELSNGAIDVWGVEYFNNLSDCIDVTYEWLQLKSHEYTHPEGKVFWVLSETQKEQCRIIDKRFEGHLLYETPKEINWDILDEDKWIERYYVYGFNNYEEMYGLIGTVCRTDEIAVDPGQSISVDWQYLSPDEYTAIISGQNLSDCKVDLTFNQFVKYRKKRTIWHRPSEVEVSSITRDQDYLAFRFKNPEIASNFQITFSNEGNTSLKIETIRITKENIYYADFYSSKWITNGEDINGTRYLGKEGVSFGPYITLVPGTYRVECSGYGLDNLSYDAVYRKDDEICKFEITDSHVKSDNMVYEFVVKSVQKQCEVRFYNNTDATVKMDVLKIQRK